MTEEVTPGVFRLGNRTVNWWVVATSDGLTVVDAGLRRHFAQLERLLEHLGRSLTDVEAVVLTHADVDHIGVAEDLRRHGVPVFIHEFDSPGARGKMRALPKEALLSFWRPQAMVATFEYARDGALRPRFVKETSAISDGDILPVPGSPRVLHVPGHSRGSCALFLEERSILFTGDALVTGDPLSGKREPTLLPKYDNVDHEQALRSLDTLSATGADLVLPGHGLPWEAGVAAAASLASVAFV
ncbi:MAG TPA: MBL fold metallo-hydrolase [Actinomycetota bacterium]|nr:MBL fold metallo-hydrolase [Actinomycetota bacterium]